MEKITKKQAVEIFCNNETLYLYWSRKEVTVDQAFTNPNMNVGWRNGTKHSDYIEFVNDIGESRLYLNNTKYQTCEVFQEEYKEGYIVLVRIAYPEIPYETCANVVYMYYYYK